MKIFTKQFFLFLLIGIYLCSCLGSGTHGSIKSYDFLVSKKTLQKAVAKVIAENPDIYRDTVKNYIIDITNGKSDTIINNRYNDGQNYVTIKIDGEVKGERCEFTFQYVGDEKDWNTLNTSSLSIAYAYDESGHGGSSENGEISSSPFLKKSLISLFEYKFIDRIKKELVEK